MAQEKMTKEELYMMWWGRWVENYPDEMFNLVNIIEDRVDPLVTIIEIGVKQCGTLRLWERLVPPGEGMVIGVDITNVKDLIAFSGRSTEEPKLLPNHGDPNTVKFWESVPGSWVNWKDCTDDRFDASKSDRQIHFVIGESTSVEVHSQIKIILKGRQADFIFHDGGHTGDIPTKDFYNIVQPFLRSGGLFALADGPRTDGGRLLLENLPPSSRPITIVPPDKAGIVLWWKP